MPGKESDGELSRYYIAPLIVVVVVSLTFIYYLGFGGAARGWLIVSLLISQVIGVILHEFGHAITAWATGAHVNFMRLGTRTSKREPWVFPFPGFPILIYGFPLCGSVQSSLYSADRYRARRCLMVAGGPFANILLLLAGVALLPAFPALEEHAILLGWLQANAALVAVSVIPMKVQIYGRTQGNDALIFWDTLHYSDERVRQIVDHAVRTRSMTVDLDEIEVMSISELEAKHGADPANSPVLMILIGKLREIYDPRHLDYLLKLIELPMSKEVIVEFIDAGITQQLNQGPFDRPEIMDQLSQRLLALDDTVSTRGTRGSVLVDLGRTDEGYAMLQDVIWKTESEFDKVYVHIFLALVQKQRGNTPAAREHAHEARKFGPDCPALQRVADLLEPDQRQS